MTNSSRANGDESEVSALLLSAPHREVLRQSWEQVAPIADEAAQLFYSRLFELDPGLRQLFHVDPRSQREKFIEALAFVVACADRPDDMRPMLIALGERHVTYGVRRHHYVTVGNALLWTLDDGLGVLQNPGARDAWVATYNIVSAVMCSRGDAEEPRTASRGGAENSQPGQA